MYNGFILRVGEISEIEKVNLARKNFGYEQEDIIVILIRNKPVRIETLEGVEASMNKAFDSLELAMEALLASMNNTEE